MTTCKYCSEPENKQERPGLVCETCFSFVHLTCLRRLSTPGDFACDVFFNYTCEDCSPTDKELFFRRKFPWVNVILLTLHHLNTHSYGMSNKGFFHYKTHIGSFIDRNWSLLFDSSFKQKKNWLGTIAGILSVYNGLLLYSGLETLREGGWWMLLHNFSPAVGAHIVQELGRDKPKWRSRNQLQLEPNLFFNKVTEMGYKDLLNEELASMKNEVIPMKKMKRSDSDDGFGTSYSDNNEASYEPSSEFQSHDTYFTTTTAKGYLEMEISPLYKNVNYLPNSDTSSVHSAQQYPQQYDSDSPIPSPATALPLETSDENETHTNKPRKSEREKATAPSLTRESLFSTELNSVELPWEEPEVKKDPTLVPLTEYEEIQLLNKVTNMIPKVRDPNKKAELRLFRSKLTVRRIKRHRHLPLFDFDRNVKILGGYVTEEYKTITTTDRVLDRFQRSYLIDNLSGTISGVDNPTVLISHIPPVPFRSPYSGTLLKPYVRIDSTAKPLWLQLQEELLKKTNGPDYVYKKADIEYSYVRPQHIAAINSLCAQHFWPGIDVSESLQCPEYSCVVTYKRLVIGAAFLVPNGRDVYISFLCTRVEWRRAGIASFMLYHLLQTCTEKDVTLHVSPTNPAIFLYQKFGFKVEELIQDFYEKYFDVHYKGCRHALFLRLVR